MPTIMLVDNGSSRPEATIALRRHAAGLAQRLDHGVHPVSLAHAGKIPAEALDGHPADTLEPFLMRRAAAGEREFLAVPLFFGPSRALTKLIPETAAAVSDAHGSIRMRIADTLCPLPAGEPRLAAILERNVLRAAAHRPEAMRDALVVLVDHGSPLPAVTAVRHWLAGQLKSRLTGGMRLVEAAMERRSGGEYAFSGPLLEQTLARIGEAQPEAMVIVALQFIGPGRHAGVNGDVETICRQAQTRFPALEILISDLIGDDDGLLEILASRAIDAIENVEACGRG